jgi:hypothetical protein
MVILGTQLLFRLVPVGIFYVIVMVVMRQLQTVAQLYLFQTTQLLGVTIHCQRQTIGLCYIMNVPMLQLAIVVGR